MSKLTMCNGPDCTETTTESAILSHWLIVSTDRPFALDFHTWECLRAYAEREVLHAPKE